MGDNLIFNVKDDDPEMAVAAQQARDTFKYFWREVATDYCRVVPALDIACVKVPFMQTLVNEDGPLTEYMWLNDILFNGEMIEGRLINQPETIVGLAAGDLIHVRPDQISDWLFAINQRAYGGFTVQLMRSRLNEQERQEHDANWGLDFGDWKEIWVAYQQDEHPEYLIEHPLAQNSRSNLVKFLSEHPGSATQTDEHGYTPLHKAVIAGNRTLTGALLEWGADAKAKTNHGKTALDFAIALQWDHIIPLLLIAAGDRD